MHISGSSCCHVVNMCCMLGLLCLQELLVLLQGCLKRDPSQRMTIFDVKKTDFLASCRKVWGDVKDAVLGPQRIAASLQRSRAANPNLNLLN